MNNMIRYAVRSVLLGGCMLALSTLARAQSPPSRMLTLREAIALALRQNPDYLITRLGEQRARQAIAEAKAPFMPLITLGSGAAYSNGMPLSIGGSAPSIFQAYGSKYIYNRPQTMHVREAAEMANASAHSTDGKAEEVAYQVASTYVDFERATRALASAKGQQEMLTRIETAVQARVESGRSIPLDLTRAKLETARARMQLEALQGRADLLEDMLRSALDLDENVRIVPTEGGIPDDSVLPESEPAAVAVALANSAELKRLNSTLAAKEYAARAERAAYLPRIDLVAQYAMLGEYNNYSDFFKTFQRNNGQLGMSFQVPLFPRSQVNARIAPILSEVAQIKLQIAAAQSNLGVETRRLYREGRQAETARDVARMDLDVAREALSVLLARMDEGRASISEVEQARFTEAQKWESFYDAQTVIAKARLNLLRETGLLVSAMR